MNNRNETRLKCLSDVQLFLIGGEDVKKRNCAWINKMYFSLVNNPVVLVIPWTTNDKVKEVFYRKILKEYFLDLGAKEVLFLEEGDDIKIVSEKFSKANILYLPGGDPKILLEKIKGKRYVLSEIEKFRGIVVGNSAGALILCEFGLIIREGQVSILNGLNLVNVSVKVHYKPSEDRELSKICQRRKITIFALPENSAIRIMGNKVETIGNVTIFTNK